MHAADPRRFFCLLQSGAQAPRTGRYDILFADPRPCLRASAVEDPAAALSLLTGIDDDNRAMTVDEDGLPFVGGFVFHLGYEAARCFEPSLTLPATTRTALPDVLLWEVPAAIIVDRLQGRAWCVSDDAGHCSELMREAMRPRPAVIPHCDGVRRIQAQPEGQFIEAAAAVLDYLRSGDAFQVNLSRAWDVQLPGGTTPAALQAAMLRQNAAPFAALLRDDDTSLLSASPERLVRVAGDRVETRPIAGTRRRGSSEAEDQRLCQELLDSGKERAEHIMLIDLERNDLGRVCVPGSVEVDELLTLEHYASVHHLVSNVRGRLRSDSRYSDVLRAVFPGGTITGCPKYRVMQIIAALEQEGRGSYTGTLGYVSSHGHMDSNILIRTMLLRDEQAWFRAGAGIVADSDPAAELAETEAKARGLLQGLGA